MQAVEALSIGEEANLCKTAVVFCTHYFDPGISARLDKLREDIARCRGLAEVHLLTETATQVPACFEPIQTRFDYRKYSAGFDGLIGERVVPGNAHLPALFFMETHPEYEYYWFIEYDVIFGGRWDRLLNDLREDPADLLATHVRALDTDDSWYWTHTLKCGNQKSRDVRSLAAFLPIYRVSKAGLNAVRDACSSGWVGHFEALMPTAVHAAGLRISDIGGVGKWTPPERRNRYYLESNITTLRDTVGTMRFRPAIIGPIIPGMLHHPCKTAAGHGVYAKWRAIRRAFRRYPMAMSLSILIALRLLLKRLACASKDTIWNPAR